MNKVTTIERLLKPIILILLSLILYYFNYQGVALIIFLVYLVDNFYQLNYYWKKDNDIDEFIKKLNKGIESNIFQFVHPLALIKRNGDIVWSNSIFIELESKEESSNKNILSIARGINLVRILNDKETLHQRLKIKGKLYDTYATKINIESIEELFLVYFNDVTEIIGYETTKESVMLIEVDNFAEALETTEESNRPLLVAEIERTINAYANNLKAMIKKYDTNKYVLSIQDNFIKKQIDEKFKILDEISKIDKGNKIEITLSIGVGRGGISPAENDKYANTAKELALGRGGDQTVVKSNDDIKFFGGNTKEIEKRTRVRARVVAHALNELIFASSNVYIVGHKNPDMDCFGAAIGLASVIKQLGKSCNIVLQNDTNAIEYYLDNLMKDPKYDDLFISTERVKNDLDDDSLFIIVDVHNKSYVSDLELVMKAKKKVIIDHHRRSPDMIEGDILNYIEVYASSTSEMVTEMIQYMVDKPKLARIEAEGLLAGIFMDTKGFLFKTGVRTFEAASFLRKSGADTIEIKKIFSDDLENYLLIAETIKSAEVNDNIAIAICPENVDTVIVAKSADELLNISGINVSFVLAQINNDIYISGRSTGDINVQVILETLGGGGHMNIAGAKVSDANTEDVVYDLKEAIKKYIKVGD
ncbi:DHH family phosphoesterase [Clostridium taeniosporum]|uniref:Cyclic-di-AMP phosphodiesterase n=1 Tax=Clostridium taeniosporum TaxID=394958 RepID=A0A1D7XND8_9CLOT|nr:DHH family phosphoesterase [Clostridium taeniosporum]AOR24862.1 DHH family phosphoesterase [Clostridium taeniosporum]